MNQKTRTSKTNRYFLMGFACVAAAALFFALRAHASSSEEIPKLAELMGWKPGTVVADVGAGDGSYAFAAAERVGATGKVFATEIDSDKLKALRAEVKK
ncbi:MAG: class I SAM-dependent methyltransferase, partial [Candidatus Acidiferrum sp.]